MEEDEESLDNVSPISSAYLFRKNVIIIILSVIMTQSLSMSESLTSLHVDWVRASNGEVPQGAVPAGKAENGVFVY